MMVIRFYLSEGKAGGGGKGGTKLLGTSTDDLGYNDNSFPRGSDRY